MTKTFLKAAVIFLLAAPASGQTQEQCAQMADVGAMFAQMRVEGIPLWTTLMRINDADLTAEERLGLTQLASMAYMSGGTPREVYRILYGTCMENAS